MKGLFKLTTAALALVTFASCSDDLFEKNGLFGDASKKGGLEVTVEDMVEPVSTRSIAIDERSTDGKKNVLLWEDGDYITVWNKDLTRYDFYQFDEAAGSFVLPANETAYVDEPTFALFNDGTGEEGNNHIYSETGYETSNPGWKRATNKTTIEMNIPQTIRCKEVDADGELAYLSNLPMWGTAEMDGETVKASLGYMTAILKIKLANVPGNAKTLVVKGYKDVSASKPAQLTGNFIAIVEENNTVKSSAALEVIDADYASEDNNYIWVDLTEEKSKQSVIYIPIVAAKYGKLQVYTTTNAINYVNDGPATLNDEAAKRTVVKIYTSKEFARGKVYAPTSDLFKEVGGDTPSAINAALSSMIEDANDLALTTSNVTTLAADDETIKIPGGMATKKITLELKGIKGITDHQTLYLDDDDFEPFEGDVILNVKANDNTTAVTTINVDLPKANVVIVSDDAELAGTAVTVNQAGSLTIGDGEAATKVGNITFDGAAPQADFISVNTGATAGNITAAAGRVNTIKVGAGAKVTGEISANFASLASNKTDIAVEITGGADKDHVTSIGTIEVGAANGSDLEIPEFTTVTTITSGKGDVSVAGTVTTLTATEGDVTITGSAGTVNAVKGDVTVNRATEGIAITTLTIGTTGKKLTLNGGYIGTISKSGDNNIAKFTIDNTETIQTAIKTITDADFTVDEKFGVAITSTWAGKTIGDDFTDDYANQAGIYTASQFASFVDGPSDGTKLYANIDLGTNAFTPVGALTKAFDGNSKTIKGGVVTYKATKAADPEPAYVGLFKTVAANVSNLTIDGLSITAETVKINNAEKTAVVGALAGQATKGTITNVNVKNVTLTSDALMVGGLIGEIATAAEGSVTITGEAQAGEGADQFSTVSAAITGKNNLGGLVGKVTSGTVAITVYKTACTFAVTSTTPASTRLADENFGTVAPYVGTVAGGVLTVTIPTGTDDKPVTAALTPATMKTLGFKNNFNTAGTHSFYGRTEVGYCTGGKVLNVTYSDNKTIDVGTATELENELANATKVNIFYKDTLY